MHTLKNQHGFSVLDIILTILLAASISAAGYFAWQNSHKVAAKTATTPSPTTTSSPSATPSPTPTPVALTAATLVSEKLHFSYPSSWSITNKTTAIGDGTSLSMDQAKVTAPDGFNVSLQTGLSGLGGACASCRVVKSIPVTAMGRQLYANFISNSGATSTYTSIELATTTACSVICIVPDKNIIYQGQPFDMMFQAGIGSNYTANPAPASQISTSADVAAALAIFESLKY